jgi:hypothetical protein
MKENAGLWEYIAGLFDGEGCIGTIPVSVNERKASMRTSTGLSLHGVRYAAGFFDAEGCLHTIPCKMQSGNFIVKNFLGFNIVLEKLCLLAIKKYCKKWGIKRVYMTVSKPSQYHRRLVYTLRINGKQDVCKFLKLIRPYSILKRPQIDIYLNEIAPKLKIGKKGGRYSPNYTKLEFLELMRSVDRLNSLKCKCRGKYNTNYFRRLWGYREKRIVDKRYQMGG